ncbi:MAG: hypothetical protein FJ134_15305 [Deltaproteobacteria bacterium]|nr:hypothetical protein [Deltaproteobacteria bacterium]
MNPKNGFIAAMLLFLFTILLHGCAGGQPLQRLVVTEYLLEEAGFQKWEVNMETPKRQALMQNIPKGKIVTYQRNGETYHAYSDEAAQTLYIGDEVAYQRYLGMARGRQLCERLDATESAPFWSCFDEYQTRGR